MDWFSEDPEAATEFAADGWCGGLGCSVDYGDSTSDSGVSDEPDYSGKQDTGGVYWPWTELAECESGGNWSADTGNGYYGGL